jgi:hypothetical protein
MSEDETCRWVVVDIDNHDDGADPQANVAMALAVHAAAIAAGFAALLLDSNSKGGYHLWVIFATPLPAADAWRLGKWLVRDFARFGLAKAPETFPKSPRHSGKRIGGWVRLPGRHHTRDHWTKVWDPTRHCWAEGREAIDLILAVGGRDVAIASVVPADFDPDRRPVRQQRPRPTSTRSPEQLRRDVALAREALAFLGDDHRDDYDGWLRVGMALSELGDKGLTLWHDWSRPSAKYDPYVLASKWAGFGPGSAAGRPLTLGTLFHMAKEEGWPGPPKRVRGVTRHRGSTTIRVTRRDWINK